MGEQVMGPSSPDDDDEEEHIRRGAAFLEMLKSGPDHGSEIPGYLIHEIIGQGQFSEVYRATDLTSTRFVAIKRLKPAFHNDMVQRGRLANEAKALATLGATEVGRHVVQILRGDESTDGPRYLILELLPSNLQERLKDPAAFESRAVATILRTLAATVHAAHTARIVHRDLKPANILLTHDEQPKLADFGVARLEQDSRGLTQNNELLGTLEYMAPEQARGDNGAVDEVSDVYALGSILYVCLTRRPPIQGANDLETLSLVRDGQAVIVPPEQLVPSVPKDLSTIGLKCLNPRKADRYRSAADLADDLGRFLDDRPIRARRTGLARRALLLARRHPVPTGFSVALVLAIAIGVSTTLWNAWESVRQARRADRNAAQRSAALAKVLEMVGDDRLRREGQRPLQVRLINDLLPEIDAVLQLEGDDPATLQLQGLAWLSLSTARRDLGDFQGSLEAASNAEKNMRKIIGSGTLVEEANIGLSTALGYQGTILGQGGAYDRAIAKLTEAATILEPRASTQTPMLLQRLGQVDNSWANCLRFGGGGTPAALGAAGRRYRQSIDAYGRVVEALKPDDPARTVCRDWQARILSNLALFVAVDLKDINQGVVLAEQAAELARGLVRDFPSEIDGLDCLASCVTNVGEIRMELKNLEAARSLHAEALGLYERLASRVPENLDFRWGVAMAASSLGQSFMDGPGEDLPRAKSFLQRAANLFDKLSAESSGNAGLAENAALNRQRLAELEKRLHPAP